MRVLLLVIFSILLSACAGGNRSVEPVNVMVLVDDSSGEALPSNHQGVKRLISQLSSGLHDAGINVYDNSALSLDDFSQYRSSMDKAALIDYARSIRKAPLDYIVLLSANTRITQLAHRTKISTRVNGEVISVNSGRIVGAFDAQGSDESAVSTCSRTCINSNVSDSLIATEGLVVEEVLAALPDTKATQTKSSSNGSFVRDYTLIFDGFTADEMTNFDDYLEIFSGLKDMRMVESRYRYAEMWYRSSIGTAKLNRNLHRMLGELDLKGLVKLEGNTVTIKKITLRGQKSNADLNDW